MAYVASVGPNMWLGNFSSDTTANDWVKANKWDTNGDGTGNPYGGMWYYNTTDNKFKVYETSWKTMGTS